MCLYTYIMEIWKPIKGFEGYYEVSSLGRVRGLNRQVWHKGNNCFHHVSGQILRQYPVSKEYPYLKVHLVKDGVHKNGIIHRLVTEAFIPQVIGKPHINHKDGNKFNNTVENLEWVNQTENLAHSLVNGIHHSVKLNLKQVEEIRERYKKGGISQRALGKEYGVGQDTISRVVSGKTWSKPMCSAVLSLEAASGKQSNIELSL